MIHKKICKNNKSCEVIMPNKENKILKYFHHSKSIEVPFVNYVDFEEITEKTSICHNNQEALHTTEKLNIQLVVLLFLLNVVMIDLKMNTFIEKIVSLNFVI